MFHGNKKKEKVILTEEELKKIEEELIKIKKIQNKIIDLNQSGIYNESELKFSLGVTKLMPDFYTNWDYRKKSILEMKNTLSEEKYFSFLSKEVLELIPIMKEHPKSYVLWYHR
jgi:hypothetical protein